MSDRMVAERPRDKTWILALEKRVRHFIETALV